LNQVVFFCLGDAVVLAVAAFGRKAAANMIDRCLCWPHGAQRQSRALQVPWKSMAVPTPGDFTLFAEAQKSILLFYRNFEPQKNI
jgi:hypothetical protein